MADNFLQLNTDKTEVMIIAPDNITPKIRQVIGGLSSSDCNDIRNLGVIFDRSLCFNSHVKSVFRSCFFHLRNIAKIRSIVSKKEMKMLVHAFISSRLDYCNVLYTVWTNLPWIKYKLYRMWLQGFWLGPAGGPTLLPCLRPFIGFLLILEWILKFWLLLIELYMVRHPFISRPGTCTLP